MKISHNIHRAINAEVPPPISPVTLLRRPIFWAGVVVAGAGTILVARTFATKTLAASHLTHSQSIHTHHHHAAAPVNQNKPIVASPNEKAAAGALSSSEFKAFTLVNIDKQSHNTAVFRFAFPNPSDVAGLPIASCLVTKIEVDGTDEKTGAPKKVAIIRPYTPINEPHVRGHLDLLIKCYPDGKMTQHLFKLKVGDTLLFKGPFPKIEYVPNKWNHVGMLAGGTGITPMWQVIQKAMKNESDKTKITLLYANVSEGDILLKQEFDQLAKDHPERFHVHYTLDKPQSPKEWKGFQGYITADMLKAAGMPTPSDNAIMFVCGNDHMMKALSGLKNPDKSQGEIDPNSLLGKLGFSKDKVYKF